MMDFSAFDDKKIKAYTEQAKEKWGDTDAYQEFEEKNKHKSTKEMGDIGEALMARFTEFGKIKDTDPTAEAAQQQVAGLQQYITDHYYQCTAPILQSLGLMYTADPAFTESIDKAGGEGTAAFVGKAIDYYCNHTKPSSLLR